MIAGNYSNNFEYVPHWLWDKHISPTEFLLYMALRSFSYPTGPTVEMLLEKTGFDPGVAQKTLWRLHAADLAERCVEDEYGELCDDRWRFCYLKYTKDAPDRAPVPVPDNLLPGEHLRQFKAQRAKHQEAYYAANPGAKEADERRKQENAEWRAAEQKQIEEQLKNLNDPHYLRSGGPINPDIEGMVDVMKHLRWSALAQIAEMQYQLAELAGLALLDPDANATLQSKLHHLAEDVECAIRHGVLDYTEIEAHDYLFEEEFLNTFTDGREIAIRVEVGMSAMDALGAPILESPAVLEFPCSMIYHINPVSPPKPEKNPS